MEASDRCGGRKRWGPRQNIRFEASIAALASRSLAYYLFSLDVLGPSVVQLPCDILNEATIFEFI